MSNEHPTPITRSFRLHDVGRALVALTAFGTIGAGLFFALPFVQDLILPPAPKDGWIIRPILAVRFGAAAVLSVLLFPILLHPISRRWKAHDQVHGYADPSGFRQHRPKRIRAYIAASIAMIAWGCGLLFYLTYWGVVSPTAIQEHVAWKTRVYSYADIRALEYIPDGERVDQLDDTGPKYTIHFTDGKQFRFGHDNEGLSRADLSRLAQFVADQAGKSWTRDSRSRKR